MIPFQAKTAWLVRLAHARAETERARLLSFEPSVLSSITLPTSVVDQGPRLWKSGSSLVSRVPPVRRPRRMGKLDQLERRTAAHVDESLGVGRTAPSAAVPQAPRAAAPARWQGVQKTAGAVEIPVSMIARDPDQPREEFADEALDRLAASLKARGQLQPIRVRWDEGRGVYV
jgi:hypothetical protein